MLWKYIYLHEYAFLSVPFCFDALFLSWIRFLSSLHSLKCSEKRAERHCANVVQDEMAPSINFSSWTTTKQHITALEFQESFLLHSSTWHIWSSIHVSTDFSQICALACNIQTDQVSHSHLTEYKLNVTIYALTMLSSPLMAIKCDFFLLLGKN